MEKFLSIPRPQNNLSGFSDTLAHVLLMAAQNKLRESPDAHRQHDPPTPNPHAFEFFTLRTPIPFFQDKTRKLRLRGGRELPTGAQGASIRVQTRN